MQQLQLQIQIPRLRTVVRHALPNLIEGTIIPIAVFLLGLRLLGVHGAMALGLCWAYGAISFRVLTRRRIPGLLLLGGLTLTARTAIALASGSTFVYFLQPSLGTVLVASAFLLSVPVGRPLAERLAHDFLPLPAEMVGNVHVRRFFLRVSLLWAAAQFANAAIAIWLLLTQSIGTFMLAKAAASTTITVTAIGISTLWFLRTMRAHGIHVRLRPATVEHDRPAPVGIG